MAVPAGAEAAHPLSKLEWVAHQVLFASDRSLSRNRKRFRTFLLWSETVGSASDPCPSRGSVIESDSNKESHRVFAAAHGIPV
jgi:hypothetical protein